MALVLILIWPLPRIVVDAKASNLIRIGGLIQSSNPKSWAVSVLLLDGNEDVAVWHGAA